jgi:hypothetical protein
VSHAWRRGELQLVLPTPSVTFAMTTDAKRNQVVHHIATELTPAFHVMDLQGIQIGHEFAPSWQCPKHLDLQILFGLRIRMRLCRAKVSSKWTPW